MRGYWNELSAVPPKDRTRRGRQNLIQLLGAYASKIFEIGTAELVDRKCDSPRFHGTMAKRYPGVVVGIKTAHYRGPEWTPVERIYCVKIARSISQPSPSGPCHRCPVRGLSGAPDFVSCWDRLLVG